VPTYCIDTSCLIAAWEERYPIDHFPNFWNLLDQAIQADKIVAPLAVHDETAKKSKDLHAWLGHHLDPKSSRRSPSSAAGDTGRQDGLQRR
jgi:hypothetical protein